MAFRARTFEVNFRCYCDPEAYAGFNIALCIAGKLPTDNPLQQLYIRPAYNPSGWYKYTFYDFFLDDAKTYDVFIQAIAYNRDSFWRNVGGIEIPDDGIGTIGDKAPTGPPANVQDFTHQFVETGVILKWSPVYDTDLSHFVIKKGTSWASATVVYTGKNTSHMLPMLQSGSYTYLIKSVDTQGKEAVTATSVSFTILKPAAPEVQARIVGENIEISWNSPTSTFPIVEYELKKNGGSFGKLKSTVYVIKAPVAGDYLFTINAINAVGEVGTTGSDSLQILSPGPCSIYPQVIDNNVLLRWNAPTTGSLPVSHYEIRKGQVYASAVVIGRIDSRFSTIFESASGTYFYWVVAVDTAGNYGAEAFCKAAVDQPPDFVLYSDIDSGFTGTRTNVLKPASNQMLAPVNTAHTWEQHFTSQSRTTPQAQIDAGFLYYMEPSLTTATYVEEIDYGVLIGGTKIAVSPTYSLLHGSVAISCKLEVRASIFDSWTDLGNVFEAYALNFQYVRYTLTFTASATGKNLILVTNINIKLSVKTKTDGGTIACLSGDVGGTAVYFNIPFLDIWSITVTPRVGSTAVYGIYDFVDGPSPTSFKILLYDKSGVRVSGTASWTARGV